MICTNPFKNALFLGIVSCAIMTSIYTASAAISGHSIPATYQFKVDGEEKEYVILKSPISIKITPVLASSPGQTAIIYAPGAPTYENITIERPVLHEDRFLWNWYHEAKNGNPSYKTIDLSLLSQELHTLKHWKLHDCLPIHIQYRIDVSSVGETIIQEITFKVSRIEVSENAS